MRRSSEWPWSAIGILGGLAIGCVVTLVGAYAENELAANALLPAFLVVSLIWPEGVHTDASIGSAFSLLIGLVLNVFLVGAIAAFLIARIGRATARRAQRDTTGMSG